MKGIQESNTYLFFTIVKFTAVKFSFNRKVIL